jgi:hypothetical protein
MVPKHIIIAFPAEIFEIVLEYLTREEISKLISVSKALHPKIFISHYIYLAQNLLGSSYMDDINPKLLKSARKYLAFEYLNPFFEIGKRPKLTEPYAAKTSNA